MLAAAVGIWQGFNDTVTDQHNRPWRVRLGGTAVPPTGCIFVGSRSRPSAPLLDAHDVKYWQMEPCSAALLQPSHHLTTRV